MGLQGFYPFLRKKGYHPTILELSTATTTLSTSTRRIDVLSRFSVIRKAYSLNSIEQAHLILEKDVEQFGAKQNLILYVDGVQAVEKEDTAKARQEAREKATVRCEKGLDSFQERVANNKKAKRRHFSDVRKNLAATFYWSSAMRMSFVEHMVRAGWTVRSCETEADVAIAQDCRPEDIVVSGDSDMLAYTSVSTLWRSISKTCILVYNISNVCQVLEMSRVQLTALAVVSNNDYGKNVYSLGLVTNFSIVKSIEDKDVRGVVNTYLHHDEVVSKNKDNKIFDIALRVFVDCKQNPITTPPPSSISPSHFLYQSLPRRDSCEIQGSLYGISEKTSREQVKHSSTTYHSRDANYETPFPTFSIQIQDCRVTSHPESHLSHGITIIAATSFSSTGRF